MCCQVNVTKGTLSQAEIDAYVDHARQKYNREPLSMDIAVDGDEVELSYDFGNVPFQRIRRITGYLVGTLDRFNNAKRAEERDRVKHGITLLNTPGTIDADYRGEIGVILVNLSSEPFVINNGERICQMVVTRYSCVEWMAVDELGETERGDGGFGHTGVG